MIMMLLASSVFVWKPSLKSYIFYRYVLTVTANPKKVAANWCVLMFMLLGSISIGNKNLIIGRVGEVCQWKVGHINWAKKVSPTF